MIRARIGAGGGARILAGNPLEKYAEDASFTTPEILEEIIFRSIVLKNSLLDQDYGF